jgi:hypothetical protein
MQSAPPGKREIARATAKESDRDLQWWSVASPEAGRTSEGEHHRPGAADSGAGLLYLYDFALHRACPRRVGPSLGAALLLIYVSSEVRTKCEDVPQIISDRVLLFSVGCDILPMHIRVVHGE